MQAPYDTRQASGLPILAEPLKLVAVAGADGTAVATSPPVPAGFRWLIEYLTTVVQTAASPAFSCYRDSADPANLLDGTTAGKSAVAVYAPPRVLSQGLVLVGVWTGCNPGDTCQLTIEYRQEAAT